MGEEVTWWPDMPDHDSGDESVANVTVNHNTRELVALLLYSIRRVLTWPVLSQALVVDNGSTDSSVELLTEVAAAGQCTVFGQ